MSTFTFTEEWNTGTAASGTYQGLATDGTSLWTLDTGRADTDAVSEINISSHAETDTTPVPSGAGSWVATDLQYYNDPTWGPVLWTVSVNSTTESMFRISDGFIINQGGFTTPVAPGVGYDGTNLWMGGTTDQKVYKFEYGDTITQLAVWDVVDGQPNPEFLHYDALNGEVWIAENGDSYLYRYSTAGSELEVIDLSGDLAFNRFHGFTFNSAMTKLWVITDDDAVQEWRVELFDPPPTLYVSNTGFRFPYPRWT